MLSGCRIRSSLALAILVASAATANAAPSTRALERSLRVREVDRHRSPPTFLRPLTVRIRAKRHNLRDLNKSLPLNPIKRRHEVFVRNFGADVAIRLVVMQSADGRYYTGVLREQARTPVALRREFGLPGARSFTMSESFGGSQEMRNGRPESVVGNVIHELAEELHLPERDPQTGAPMYTTQVLMRDVALTPDRSAGAGSFVIVRPRNRW